MSSEDLRTWKLSKSSLWMDPMFTSVIDVQKRIRSQSYGRQTKSKQSNRERTLSTKYNEIIRFNSNELNAFFNKTNDQIMRMSYSQTLNRTSNKIQEESDDQSVTLGEVCSVASYVANKITAKKSSLDSIRGLRLPSIKLYHGKEPKKMSTNRNPIRLVDILPKNDEFERYTQ